MNATRDQIITLADEFIRTRGFNAFSYADIGSVIGVRNAAIHYYFPSKTDLGISVVDKEITAMARLQSQVEELPGDQQLRTLVDTFFNSSRKGRICLTGSLTPDYATLPPIMQEKVQEMCTITLDWVTGCLEKGRAEGRLSFPGAPKDRALLVMSGLLSSLLLSRVLGAELFDRMIGQLLQDLQADFQVTELSVSATASLTASSSSTTTNKTSK
ncbi:MAG TPA: TetR/AcrR family transcriptional regulator [Puia sp.]|nr:TetR/AcrR family transcriptional regulator [Puia sp.]